MKEMYFLKELLLEQKKISIYMECDYCLLSTRILVDGRDVAFDIIHEKTEQYACQFRSLEIIAEDLPSSLKEKIKDAIQDYMSSWFPFANCLEDIECVGCN